MALEQVPIEARQEAKPQKIKEHVPTQAEVEAQIAARIAEAQAEADKEIMAMGKQIGDEADLQLLGLLKKGVQHSSGSEGDFDTPLVGAHVSAIRVALQRAGRLKIAAAPGVKIESKGGEDGVTRVIVSYEEAPHADADD